MIGCLPWQTGRKALFCRVCHKNHARWRLMSRAPWNIVLHPAAGTAGRPLVTASAAATCRRLHIYQSQGDFIEKLRIAFDNTRLRKPRPAQNIEEQSSVASSSKQGKCPDTCQKRANPQAVGSARFCLLGKRSPSPFHAE